METLSTSGDTWGIPGPTFLRIYLAAAVLLIIIGWLHRRRLFRGQATGIGTGTLDAQQAAYLNGGDRLALYAALATLRGSGTVHVDEQNRLVLTGSTPARMTPLEQAIWQAASAGTPVRRLETNQFVAAALRDQAEQLQQTGLLVDASARWWARFWPALLLVLGFVGLFRLVAGLANDRPVGFLLLSLTAVGTVALIQLRRIPRPTRAGRQLLQQLHKRHSYLSPGLSPAYTTYGPAGAAMGVALFGVASLWMLDPGFAAQAEVQRNMALNVTGTGGSTGSSNGYVDGGSGSGDGGGGCGGGCGG